MGETTGIEWCHHTFNPWRGCTKVSTGCRHCYAETLSHRNPDILGVWGDHGTRVVASESMWSQPLKWNAAAEKAGERRRVFCASLADVFEDRPELVKPRRRLAKLIHATPGLDWLLLTKRPENMDRMIYEMWFEDAEWPKNIWLGTSVENQETANERIPQLALVRGHWIKWLSMEPLVGPVDLPDTIIGIDWIVAGGESGPKARPPHPIWFESIRQQCEATRTRFLFKQWGEWSPDEIRFRLCHTARIDTEGRDITDTPGLWDESDAVMYKIGKKIAGRELNGIIYDGYPT